MGIRRDGQQNLLSLSFSTAIHLLTVFASSLAAAMSASSLAAAAAASTLPAGAAEAGASTTTTEDIEFSFSFFLLSLWCLAKLPVRSRLFALDED